MPIYDTSIYIKPNTITNLTIWVNSTQLPCTYSGTSGEYAEYEIRATSSNITLKAEGYQDQNVTIADSSQYNYFTMVPDLHYISTITHKDVTYTIKDAEARTALAGKQDTLATQTAYTSKGSATKVPQITTNSLGQVTGITEVDITHQSIKTLNTDNTTGQTTSSSETIAGSGSINLHKVSKTGSYNDLLDKPTIPTVNNSTITIQKNGTTVDSFTLNQSSDKSINITVPTTASDVGAVSTTDGVTGVVAGSTANKINVTKNGSTSTITIDNVENATKATQDANGNTITTTYATKTEVDDIYAVTFVDWGS